MQIFPDNTLQVILTSFYHAVVSMKHIFANTDLSLIRQIAVWPLDISTYAIGRAVYRMEDQGLDCGHSDQGYALSRFSSRA